MVKRFTLIAFLIALSCSLSYQQIKFCPQPEGYDVANLTVPHTTWEFDLNGECFNDNVPTSKCTFNFAFCEPLPSDGECDNSGICQKSQNSDIIELGSFVPNPFENKDVNGFYAIFKKSKPIFNIYSNQTCNLTIRMEFDCNQNAPWINTGPVNQAPEPISFSQITEKKCEIGIKFEYAGACYKIDPITTTTKKPDSGDGGLSGGSVLLIIFFVFLSSYLIIGILYNKIMLRESGYFVIPHIRQWSLLLLHIIDGVVFSWRFVTCQNKQLGTLDSTYQEI